MGWILIVKGVVSGLFFGAWPLLMNRSKMPSGVSAIVLGLVSTAIVAPFGIGDLKLSVIMASDWKYAVFAGIASGVGIVFFNGGLAATNDETVSGFFVVMIIVQVSVAAVYNIAVTGNLNASRIFGFALVPVCAYFLLKK